MMLSTTTAKYDESNSQWPKATSRIDHCLTTQSLITIVVTNKIINIEILTTDLEILPFEVIIGLLVDSKSDSG